MVYYYTLEKDIGHGRIHWNMVYYWKKSDKVKYTGMWYTIGPWLDILYVFYSA